MYKQLLICSLMAVLVLPLCLAQEAVSQKKFAKGAELQARKDLYKLILKAKDKGVGISSLLKYFDGIEKKAASGADAYSIRQEIRKVEKGLKSQSVEDTDKTEAANKKVPGYVSKLDALLKEKIPPLGSLANREIIEMKIQTVDGPYELKTKQKSETAKKLCKKFDTALKSIGQLPTPPKAFFCVDVAFDKKGKVSSVKYTGKLHNSKESAANNEPEYMATMIKIHRTLNANFRSYPAYKGLVAKVKFELQKNGKVTDLKLIKSSGLKHMDQMALYTVKKCSPFKIQHNVSKGVTVRYEFLGR